MNYALHVIGGGIKVAFITFEGGCNNIGTGDRFVVLRLDWAVKICQIYWELVVLQHAKAQIFVTYVKTGVLDRQTSTLDRVGCNKIVKEGQILMS